MYCSGEVRWFLRGKAEHAVENWIRSGGLAQEQEPRTDRYLVLPGCTSAGIKIREGNFEIKAQTSPTECVAYTDAVAGSCNTWVKWSRTLDDFAGIAQRKHEDERWVAVRKQRTLRLFSLESDEPVEVAYGGPWLAAGCQVEKTVIDVLPGEERWWSFSFEAFGEPGLLLRHLELTVRAVAQSAPAITLRKEDSMSYPEWLSAL